MLSSTIKGRLVQTTRAVLASALLMATAVQGAHAQQAARLRVAVEAGAPRAIELPRSASLRHLPVAPDSGEHVNPVVRGAQIGAIVGVAAGLVYTLALNTKKSCTEQNNVVCAQDEHDYRTFTYPIYGGVLGGIVGALVGRTKR